MTNPQNLEPRLEQVEIDMADLKQLVAENAHQMSELRIQMSQLRSEVSTLVDIVGSHEVQIEESRRLQDESRQRFDRFVEQAEQDRALMLQLIQSIAQGRNGGER